MASKKKPAPAPEAGDSGAPPPPTSELIQPGPVRRPTGWIPPDDRTRPQQEAHERIVAGMPKFTIRGRTNFAERRYPLWRPLVDMHGKKPPYSWQQTGSCFPAGTPVRMADGTEKPVESVAVGDEVVTHTGCQRRVVDVMRRGYTGEMIEIIPQGFPFPLRMTADHPVAVMRTGVNWRWQPDQLEWVRAGDLREDDRIILGFHRQIADPREIDLLPLLGDAGVDMDELAESEGEQHGPYRRARAARYSGVPGCPTGRIRLWNTRYENAIYRRVAVTESFARLLGLYTAEGGCHAGRVVFTYSAAERDTLAAETLALVRGVFGVDGQLRHEPERGRTTVRFGNATLAAVLQSLCPGDVHTKRVPAFIFNACPPIRAAFFGGWFAGDGYYRPAGERPARMQGVTASAALARDMTTLALSLGYKAACSLRKARGHSGPAWDVYLSGHNATRAATAAKGVPAVMTLRGKGDVNVCPYGYCRPLKKIVRTQVEAVPVYDFEVEEDHSFIAGGVVVHNCVGSNGHNALVTLAAIEIRTLNQPEEFRRLFWPYTYGLSRKIGGMSGRGEGSFGSAWAEAILEYGIFEEDPEGEDLEDAKEKDGWIVHSSAVELKWSDGGAIPEKLKAIGRKNRVRTVAPIRRVEDAVEAAANGYTMTIASMFGTKPRKSGTPPVLLGGWDDQWAHQMWIDEFWDHPTLGPIFHFGNDWGWGVHGSDPDPENGPPNCGFYVTEKTLGSILAKRDAECYALSAYDGYPARDIWDWGF